jgi:hypothetical protein
MSNFIDKWGELKQQIKRLEQKCVVYKNRADKLMTEKDINTIRGDAFTIIKKPKISTRIKKTDIPLHLWDQYSSVNSYSAFYVKKNK